MTTCTRAERVRKHFNSDMYLHLVKEEAMCLESEIPWTNKTARVQVNITFKDDDGIEYHATRIVKMRLKRES